MADLSVEVAGIGFKNPVWLASAESTWTYDKMKRGIDVGAGAVVAVVAIPTISRTLPYPLASRKSFSPRRVLLITE